MLELLEEKPTREEFLNVAHILVEEDGDGT
jgi:hypothetical protein